MMNKNEFLKELAKQTGYEEEKCGRINGIIEDTFLIGKKNKEKMIADFKEKLNIDDEEANKIYETAIEIISKGIKDKLKHPFKSQD